MTLTQKDWKQLRFPILGLGLAMIAAGLLASFVDQYRTEEEQSLMIEQGLYNQARQKFESSGQEKETIIKYLPEYNRLLSQGFIGEERRIEWIERLRQIHGKYNLFSIDYSIGQQERYKPSFISNTGNHIINRSVMELKLDMLHEGDLIHLVEDLHQDTPPFMVRECEITRPIGTDINSKKMIANLKAVCEIDWITLRDPELGKGL
ncbi:MAG TPA: hypothetical protein VLM20_05735 [Methylophilaceae bacterium]|nr:hypothetical protein [Methylophilaceae bacterium]